jgi:hypothetical protein
MQSLLTAKIRRVKVVPEVVIGRMKKVRKMRSDPPAKASFNVTTLRYFSNKYPINMQTALLAEDHPSST